MKNNPEISAVILCAGKGTRMNDTTKNKVCFDCAGQPVIKRILSEMRLGGVSRFVIVTGYKAENVMDTLDGEDGVVYAYQKEQRGTGHAALCGLKALNSLGIGGSVIISMGDKIVSHRVISRLISLADGCDVVWGVQPRENNPGGGHVAMRDGRPYGIVEHADVCFELLAGIEKDERAAALNTAGLNAKKAEKVLALAENTAPAGYKLLGREKFTADELLNCRYANAGLYCFDCASALDALSHCGSDNAQCEIYLTDTLEYLAETGKVSLCEITESSDMRTFSTRPELSRMADSYLQKASEIIGKIEDDSYNDTFEELYGIRADYNKERYTALLKKFIADYGDRKVIISRSPGRVNLMGRHIDHRGGHTNVMAADCDTVIAVSPREDSRINAANLNPAYAALSFDITEELPDRDKSWLDYLDTPAVRARLEENRGSWINYIRSAVLRLAHYSDIELRGMDIELCGDIPPAAGLSSSSSIVVAVTEAVSRLNSLNISEREFVELCGEGEWYVGSRGGAGDHAAMKCSRKGEITSLGYKPFTVGEHAPFPGGCAVIVADSGIKARKSEGSRDIFNSRVASYEFAQMYLQTYYPDAKIEELRDMAEIRPYSQIYRMLLSLPEKADRATIRKELAAFGERAERIFSTHADPGIYDIRGIALYGICECARATDFLPLLEKGNAEAVGEMMKLSHRGDSVTDKIEVTTELLQKAMEDNISPALLCGSYACSTPEIDELTALLDSCRGVYGSELVGAGLGGCVIALAEEKEADNILSKIFSEYYDRRGLEHTAYVCRPSCGSSVIY